jgi:hypothetical protein
VSPRVGVHQWQADWQNHDGNIVSYSLRYLSAGTDLRSELSSPTTSDMQVTAFLIPAATAQAMKAAAGAAKK